MIKKIFLLVTFFLTITTVNAQVCQNLDAGEDIIDCSDPNTPNEVDLTATLIAPNYKTTRSYEVGGELLCPPIPYDGSRSFIAIDDSFSTFAIDIPFTFCFYENQYDQILISGNGIVTFDLTVLGQFSDWNTDPNDFLGTNGQQNWQTNAIFGVYHDMDSSVQPRDDRISYKTEGVAPNRKFIISFDVLQFQCNDLLSKSQITLYESSNVIDVRVDQKPVCNTWNEGLAVVGIQNKSGTRSQTGREHGVWTPEAEGELWRFVPNGEDLDYTLIWYDESGNIVNQNNEETITVPAGEQETYTVQVIIDDQCNDSTAVMTDSVSVTALRTTLYACEDPVGSGVADFNLDQEVYFLNGLDENDYDIIFYNTQAEAENDVNPIPAGDLNPYNSATIELFIRIENLIDGTFSICTFNLFVATIVDTSFSYDSSIYCSNEPNPIPTQAAVATYSITNGGVIDPITGEIDLVASGLGDDGTGQFTITHGNFCSNPSTFDITIELAIDSSFVYPSSVCLSGNNPIPTSVTTTGGVFAVDGGASIDSATGELDLATTTGATIYTITYTFSGGNCPSETSQTIEVLEDDTSFTYPSNQYCDDAVNPIPNLTGAIGGEYTISNGGVIDIATGEIDIIASGLGNDGTGIFTITYSIVACGTSTDFIITIELIQDASFDYPTSICDAEANPIATNFVAGGTFDVDGGATINPTTGELDLSTTTSGTTYTITYSFGGNCPSQTEQTIEVVSDDDSSFTYSTPFCNDGTNPLPTANTPGGTYTINNGGVLIDVLTGEVNLLDSGLGDDGTGIFTVTYTTEEPCSTSTNFDITIELTQDASFEYPTEVCFADSNPLPANFVTGGTFGVGGGATIDVTTGELDLSTTTAGTTYTITYSFGGNCPSQSTQTINIVIEDDSTFTYSTPFCNNGTNPLPTANTLGGTYTINNGGVLVDALTGEVNLLDSGLGDDGTGVFTVTYTTEEPCSTSSDFDIIIELVQDASFEYPIEVCFADSNPIATNFVAGGTFEVGGGATIDPITGELDLSTTTAGVTYVIIYNLGVNCPSQSTQTINVVAEDNSSFAYPSSPFCNDGTNPFPTANTSGGTYTINNGGVLVDAFTGEVNLLDSGLGDDGTGNFEISYTTTGDCSTTTTNIITIQLTNDASFEYPTEVCIADSNPLPANFITGGTFGVDGGASINPATGELDLSSTIEGDVYTITYNFFGNCPSSNPNVHEVLIIQSPTANNPFVTTVLTSCNNGNGTANFDINASTIEEEIIDAQTGVTVTYHSSYANAENGSPIIETIPFAITSGNVWARVENSDGCFDIVDISSHFVVEQCFVIIPEGFSPNSSIAENQTFNINGIRDMFPNYEIKVYNRYGNEVYSGNASSDDWNGKMNNTGEELPVGTYFYGLELNDDQKITHRGWVYLQR